MMDKESKGIHLEEIIEGLQEYQPEADEKQIQTAYAFASQAHGGQIRRSGEPYMSHPMHVALILTRMKMDADSIVTALLHDTVEDTDITLKDVADLFGNDIARMVDGLTKLSKIKISNREERQAENVRKMILAMSKDVRIVIIKLADRLHNMSTLEFLKPDRQQAISEETLDIYAPLASRLGIEWLKHELEGYSFRYVYPAEYKELKQAIEERKDELDRAILTICTQTRDLLQKERIKGEVFGRTKEIYSIFKKMRDQELELDKVHDIVGVRIVTNDLMDCYRTLGLVHSLWKPIPGKFKDYIALPKPNMYQSIHTTVLSDLVGQVEFQVRTHAMHRVSENGIAAHWRYKDKGSDIPADDDGLVWIHRLIDIGESLDSPEEFLENLKIDLFQDEVYIFTPKHEVKAFPKGATPLDFAYSVHTQVGHKCVGALVNRVQVPLDYQLKSGETVEIVTDENQQPGREWLTIAKTSHAKAKILAQIRSRERVDAVALSMEILQAELNKYSIKTGHYLTVNEETYSNEMEAAREKLGFKSTTVMLLALSKGKLPVYSLLENLLSPKDWSRVESGRKRSLRSLLTRFIPKRKMQQSGVKIGDISDTSIRFAGCCNPVPGDSIVGYASSGQGLVIHTRKCTILKKLEPDKEQLLEARWDVGIERKARPVRILVYSQNKPGILGRVSNTIAKCDANIAAVTAKATDSKGGQLDITVEIRDLPHLEKVCAEIKKVDGIKYVKRVMDR